MSKEQDKTKDQTDKKESKAEDLLPAEELVS